MDNPETLATLGHTIQRQAKHNTENQKEEPH